MKYDTQNYQDKCGEYQVHTITSGQETFFTNAFVIETKKSLVVVDTMMTVSDARAVRKFIDKLNKPLNTILVTHGHPDHYNGVGEIIAGLNNVSVITIAGVDEDIRRTDDAKEIKWKPHFGDDWPAVRVFPNKIVESGFSLKIDEIPFQVYELGPGESNCDIYWIVGLKKQITFVGDVIFNGTHSYMNDGHSGKWLRSLDILEKGLCGIDVLYTGHGPHGEPTPLIDFQRSYLRFYRKLLTRLLNGDETLSESSRKVFINTVKEKYPGFKLDVFIDAGIDSVINELIKENLKVKEM
jgi:glyoxylase-like metal-dependent hydrolase (beta-lactamase superfamily II)